MSTGSQAPAPYPTIAMAWAPPTAYTSVTASRAHAARTPGSGRPPLSRCGGLVTAIDSTPAICAGTTFITTELSSGARPPGTYSPTRRTGTQRSVTRPPRTTSVVTSVRRWSACTRRTRAIASSSAARTAGSMPASASSSADGGTARSGTSTPSRRAVISRTAWAPRSRTSSQSGRTTASTESMSVAARGSSWASSRGPGSADLRRSMRDSTEHLRGRTGEHPTVDARVIGPRCPYAPAVGPSGEAGSASDREIIPLFPLETPLFPGVVLPLHVFEPRYRRLVADLTALPAGAERRFGVVAIRQGGEVERIAPAEALFDVGCTAVLRMVAPQQDGGYRAAAVGGERFRLIDVLVPTEGTDEPPYLRALVEWLSEEETAAEAAGNADEVIGGHPA